MDEIVNIITNVGFPILMCLLMYKRVGESDALHKEEVDNLAKVIDGNTSVLEKLTNKIDNFLHNKEV